VRRLQQRANKLQGNVRFKGEQTGNEIFITSHPIDKTWVRRNIKRIHISQEDNGKAAKRQWLALYNFCLPLLN
jgi:hypothetical protein